jgi:hypothetical protein
MLEDPPARRHNGLDGVDEPEPVDAEAAGRHTLKRAAMAAATAFIAVNIWTGAPLFSLWVGSRVVGGSTLSMRAVIVVVAVLATLVFAMALVLGWLNASYNRLTGRRSGSVRLAWLRSWNEDEGDDFEAEDLGTSALERIVMACVYIAVIALLVWFFAFAGSPLPG